MRKQAKWILLIIIVVISTQVLSAQTNVSGEVSGIWELANSPYIVVGDISIVGDSLLVIEAGVEVRFDGFYQFVAYGILSAIGTESEPILFTANATTPSPGDWYNIELSDSCIIQYSIIEYAGQPEPATNRFAIRLSGSSEVLNNVIRHNNVSGIGAMFESSIIRRNLIYDNSTDFFVGAGIYSQWSSAKIENNTIADNNFGGMLHQANSDSLTVINNIIVNNSGVGFQYDQITGSPFPIADYNNVWGNSTNYVNLTPGANSISEDPLFVGADDYHLTADSPCIDAGDPAFPLDPDGTIADMGAYPFYQDFEIVVTDLSYAVFSGGLWLTEDQIIDEGDSLNFFIVASDPNGNDLEYEWLLDGEDVSIESTYSFLTDENSAGEYEITLFLTDNFGYRNELNYLWNITVNDVSGSGEVLMPIVTKLFQNHPNPFNPITNIQFDIKENETGVLSIFNLKGQIIESQRFNSGKHDYLWNAENCSSGIYFYKLKAGNHEETKKMILLK
ncbi:MAG: T9SS type A sorting domain-containing protein [Candidatus Cloacimonetes bacterium]|nr:T9SS type A sorting domain-containing protein [Candidatus Cloacimonadota bacterium]